MAILTERGQWANATVTERGKRVFSNGLDERGRKVFGLSGGTTTTQNASASGGSTSGGTASVTYTQNTTASGGSTSGGTGTAITTQNASASGGSTSGGTSSSLNVSVNTASASGGSTSGGTATSTQATIIYVNVTASGGSTSGGSATSFIVPLVTASAKGGSTSGGTVATASVINAALQKKYVFIDGLTLNPLQVDYNLTNLFNYLNAQVWGINAPVQTGATSLSITNLTQLDNSYMVTVVTSWLTNYSITGKTSTGFTINFGTAAPSNASLDWRLMR